MKRYDVTILGATGLVGQEFIKVLVERNFPMSNLRLLASDRSAGKRISVDHKEVEVREAVPEEFQGTEIVLVSGGNDVSRRFSPMAAQGGAVVVDNSSAFRMDPEVPLVVPEVNPEDIGRNKGIIANPNCSTIQMVVALYPLHKVNPIRRIVVDTYQSVSGAGLAAIEEMRTQARDVLDGRPARSQAFPYQIAFNLLPEIDVFLDSGYTKEEWKMIEETRKIMHAPEMAISATCVRVPVLVAHSEAVHVEFAHPMSPEEARQILSGAPGVKVVDDPSRRLYPQPWDAAGRDDVLVGRIRRDNSHPNGLAMWVVADNLRKGAALNAIQIAEEVARRGLVPTGGRR
ncbi:MAG: aspartate-semialdehyde dehydrogenase [Chloroflexi bacterium]|nr:aspartate-semialdehyde dehydrogenase [Chloroflexota bacterium]